MMPPVFFTAPAELRDWLAAHHAAASELWIGFYKKASRRPGITYVEALDEALCAGWIDGVRKSLGKESYTIRFTPRKSGSIWSTVNVNRVRALTDLGRMQPAGLKAFEARKEGKVRFIGFTGHKDPRIHAKMLAKPPRRIAAWWERRASIIGLVQKS